MRWIAIAVAVVALARPEPCIGFVQNKDDSGAKMRWNVNAYDAFLAPDQNPQTLAIRYRIGNEGSGQGFAKAEANAVRTAFALWQLVSGTRVRFEEMPGVANSSAAILDGANTVTWAAPGSPYIDSSSIARTTIASDQGVIIEADITLNRTTPWNPEFQTPNSGAYLTEAVVLHEIGHLLGLLHTPLGAGTMYWRITQGMTPAAGLSSDETAAIRALYGEPNFLKTVGSIKGRVTLGGRGVFGAMVTAEKPPGIVQSATLSDADGNYELPALDPGPYAVRALPLDPDGPSDGYLVRGTSIDEFTRNQFAAVATNFRPSADATATVSANKATSLNFSVTAGSSPFRITEIRLGLTPEIRASGDLALQIPQGQTSDVGVYLNAFPGNDAVLRIGGDHLAIGATEVIPNALRNLTLVHAPVTPAAGASTGLRSISVVSGGSTAWASGFIEVLGPFPDQNSDGLDDLFQRRYFAPFTVPEAGATADPDRDGWTNQRERLSGSDPTDPASIHFRILSTKLNADGTTTVTSESAPGRRFQLWRRDDFGGGAWEPVGAASTAVAETVVLTDPVAAVRLRAYRVAQVQ